MESDDVKSENEKRRRIRLALWAYAYEIRDHSLVSDQEFDTEARLVDLSVDTDRPDLDVWYRENFAPYTGSWIHKHPELSRIEKTYARMLRSESVHYKTIELPNRNTAVKLDWPDFSLTIERKEIS